MKTAPSTETEKSQYLLKLHGDIKKIVERLAKDMNTSEAGIYRAAVLDWFEQFKKSKGSVAAMQEFQDKIKKSFLVNHFGYPHPVELDESGEITNDLFY